MTNPIQEEKQWMLIDMMEHPERYTEEQVKALLADPDISDLFRSMALVRMAEQKAHPGKVDVDGAWKAFASAHRLPSAPRLRPIAMLRKIAASIIAFIGLSVIALAAIHIGLRRPTAADGDRQVPTEQSVALADTAKTDTTQTTVVAQADSLKPVVFDNAELGTVVTQLAAFYHAKVVFENDEARHIRVFFNWDKTKTLSQNLDILNAFERIQIMEDHGTLKVK